MTALGATALDALVFLAIMGANPQIPLFAASLGAAAGGAFAFFVNRKWSFRAQDAAVGGQGLRWLLIWACSAILNVRLILFALELGLSPLLSKVGTAAVVGVFFNFPLHRYFVFRRSDLSPAELRTTWWKRNRSATLRWGLRVLIFPWFFFTLSQYPARALREYFGGTRLGRMSARILALLGYVIIALPPTLMIFFELLITLNEEIIGEQANYRLQSDFLVDDHNGHIALPGPKTPPLDEVVQADSEEYYQYLVEKYSPTVVQKLSYRPEWDIPVFLDYDGTRDPYDNVINEPRGRPHPAGVYGEVTAQTEDSYYLTYSFYHVKDYDHPIREMLTRWTYHDSDNEGYHIRVDSESLEIVSIETWFHNRFLLFNHSGLTEGTEPVHGKIHLEGETHPIIYVQPQGHGVRCAQYVDGEDLTTHAKILRFQGKRPEKRASVDTDFEANSTYQLRDFSNWYKSGKAERGTKEGELFSESIVLGEAPDGSPIEVAAFISGEDFHIGGWSRPKPMWAWDDGWDEIPVFWWHAYPSRSFESHEGIRLSHEYKFSRPIDEMLGMTADELESNLEQSVVRRRSKKWKNLKGRGGVKRKAYFHVLELKWKEYMNYLFHALG